MYIQKAEITNIKSIEKFEIEFKNPAGWHVLIGDNGAGKSTIVRSIALALIGAKESYGLRTNPDDWINWHKKKSSVSVNLIRDNLLDELEYKSSEDSLKAIWGVFVKDVKDAKNIFFDRNLIDRKLLFEKESGITETSSNVDNSNNIIWERQSGFFSAAFGPYRRFEGGSSEWEKIYSNSKFENLAAHLSIFNESVALTEPIKWLNYLNYKSLEKNKESKHTLENLKKLINSDDFLPHSSKLKSVSSEGVFFKDGNGILISVNQMSDGYRSILSLTFELMRQLIRVYGSKKVFKNIEKGEMFIDLPGVVLIDEIDAHLHPTWQTRIGQWFLKYFPQLQFIVTTHSPLVCRACEKGSIWRLAAPGSNEKSGEVTGIDRDRLIYGNILDAYGTEIFGSNVSISKESVEKQEDLIKLSKKEMLGIISEEEQTKLDDLRDVFTTNAEVEI